MKAVAIIPARYGSTRFPGKPLLRETGKYLIQHVYERVAAARRITRCLIATDDQRIADAVAEFGGQAVMTRPDHPSGTDRIAEVVRKLPGDADDIILNVQGDEPEIDPTALDRLVARLAGDARARADAGAGVERCPVGTLACPFAPDADPRDPNAVKVVTNLRGHALYFSRSLLPYVRSQAADAQAGIRPWLLHLGVYAYRRAFLLEYAGWEPTPLESLEKLEQLRILEHGVPMAVELLERASPGVDTPEDYARFVARWRARTEPAAGGAARGALGGA
jgi:3-deoxy-manno-octulosonate cytidylyltransferase (CMP-KDO synthetase)